MYVALESDGEHQIEILFLRNVIHCFIRCRAHGADADADDSASTYDVMLFTARRGVSVWFGLVWFGLVSFGLVWFGLVLLRVLFS
jgi:hypothetical protein